MTIQKRRDEPEPAPPPPGTHKSARVHHGAKMGGKSQRNAPGGVGIKRSQMVAWLREHPDELDAETRRKLMRAFGIREANL